MDTADLSLPRLVVADLFSTSDDQLFDHIEGLYEIDLDHLHDGEVE